jgi:hypothetical protein
MKNTFIILFISFLLVSCQQKINPNELSKINGYWEIEKVVFDKGEDKKYTLNEHFDYFEISNNKGIRKKVKPQLDGTFLVNNTFERVAVRMEDEKVFLDYSTAYSKWTEEIITLSDEKLVLKNTKNTQYHYKKATAITILDNGKKTK